MSIRPICSKLCPFRFHRRNSIVIIFVNNSNTNSVNRVCIAIIDENDNNTVASMESKWTQFRANWPDRHFYLLQPSSGGNMINQLRIPPSFLEQTDPDSTTADTEPSD